MNRIQFGEGGCDKIRKYLDSYISNELLVETNHELLRHLESCPACAADLEARTRLRARLKTAVKSQTVPPELPVRLREKIRSRRAISWLPAASWAAVAAGLALCAVWLSASRELPALSDAAGQADYIERVSAPLAAVFKPGLGDHIHCSVFRKYPADPPSTSSLEAGLGTDRRLLPLMCAAVPQGYRPVMAHHCGYAGRRFIHLTFERRGSLLSLVITRRFPGETTAGLTPSSAASGTPIYQSAAGPYHIAAFEAGDNLGYVISELGARPNLEVANAVAQSLEPARASAPVPAPGWRPLLTFDNTQPGPYSIALNRPRPRGTLPI
ncbi:MAG TPA: zf-HC2 domain-containing protein [Bryobacteraceae bacterium]|jgi:anti-sigma factor (TIGR02949 family)